MGNGGILDAKTGELEMRLATATKLMLAQKDDWFAAGLQVEASCREIEASFGASLQGASRKMDALGERAMRLSARVAVLRDDKVLEERAGELAAQRGEVDGLVEERMKLAEELVELRVQTKAERADIELVKDKLATNARLDAEVEAKQKAADASTSRAEEGERRQAEATRKTREMEASMVKVRDELRDEVSMLHQAKLAEESALGEAQEQMLRTKRLYSEYRYVHGPCCRPSTLSLPTLFSPPISIRGRRQRLLPWRANSVLGGCAWTAAASCGGARP